MRKLLTRALVDPREQPSVLNPPLLLFLILRLRFRIIVLSDIMVFYTSIDIIVAFDNRSGALFPRLE